MTLGVLLQMARDAHGDRVALGRVGEGISFAQLARLAAGGARYVRGERARHLVLLGRNGPAVPHAMFAGALAGVPFTPLNYRLAAGQVAELLADLDEPLVVADDQYLPLLPAGTRAIPTTTFTDVSSATEPGALPPVDPHDPAVLLFTSGTTAKPKTVVLRHENLLSYILSTVEFASAHPSEATLTALPPYHVAAVASVLSSLYSGCRVLYLPDFTPRRWLDLVRAEKITRAMVVPTMLKRIVEYLDGRPADTPALRTLSYGGARMPLPVLEQALAAFPYTGFVNAYGLTETSSTIALLGPEDHRAALAGANETARRRLASVGRAVPGIEFQIRAPDGRNLAVGEPGELWVRGSQVSGEYGETGSVLDEAGWFPTRDRAWLDADGFLFIDGRSDDTIIRGGENINPAEIEDVLITHPAVADVGVVGAPDDEWGERLVAVVVLRAGAVVSKEELRDFVRARLRGSRTPEEVLWRAELPHTPTGKLLRRELVRELSGRHSE